MKAILLLFLGVIYVLTINAQTNSLKKAKEYSSQAIFENFDYQDGLPNHEINTVTRDRYGFVWFGTQNGLVKYDGLTFKVYQNNPLDSTSLSNNFIWQVLEDKEGIFWLPTHGGGLNRFDPRQETFSVFPLNNKHKGEITSDVIWSVMEDSQNRIWVGTKGYGLYIINADRDAVKHFVHDPNNPESLSGNLITNILEDRQGRFWVPAYKNGLNLFDPESGKAIHFRPEADNPNSIASDWMIIGVIEDENGLLWIPTDKGLSALNMKDTSFTNYFHDPGRSNSLSSNYIRKIEQGANGRFWLATDKGLDLFSPKQRTFQHFDYQPFNPHSLIFNFIRGIHEDQDGILWISTGNGAGKLVPRPFTFLSLVKNLDEKKLNRHISGKFVDSNGIIWIHAGNGELITYDPTIDSFQKIYEPGSNASSVPLSIRKIREDTSGQILIQTNRGIFSYNRSKARIEKYCSDQNATCRILSELRYLEMDHWGNFWGINKDALIKVITKTGKTISYPRQPKVGQGLLIPIVTKIVPDQLGRIWLAGEGGGLQFFDTQRENYVNLSLADELPKNFSPRGNSIFFVDSHGWVWINYQNRLSRLKIDHSGSMLHKRQWATSNGAIREDLAGQFWLVQPDGISEVDTINGPQKTYSLKGITNSLSSNVLVAQSGRLYLGSNEEGFYIFDPTQANLNSKTPRVVFTDFKIYGKSVPIRGTYSDTLDWPSPLEQSIQYTKTITLPHHLNDFTFEFVALDFFQPKLNQYKYLLKGFDKDTIITSSERPFAPYTNLSPGKYTFQVWGSNNDGVWNMQGAKLDITILSPWYWSFWSKTAYLLLLLGILFAFYWFQLNRQLALAEAHRLKELDSVKTKLYTNITHEFRTPLTIILGMVRQIRTDPKKWYNEGLEMIHRNGRQLLQLINQMLDLSKLDNGKLDLHPQPGEMVSYLNYLVQAFESFAEGKNIQLHFLSEVESLEMDYDPSQWSKVVSNLLSNAIKFTPEGGNVYLSLRQLPSAPALKGALGTVEISVKDTGQGISEENLPFIFDRFYQIENGKASSLGGTGIGLSLVKELVELMEGKIQVQSKRHVGTTFTIHLPIYRSAKNTEATKSHKKEFEEIIPPMEASALSAQQSKASLPPSSSATILLIEDNPDVMRYLASCLESTYYLEYATNGREGVEMAIELTPDLVISDVMMPEMDGYQVTETLKNDERTSHIPILLLTAKADRESRIEGLKQGADAYLPKPFDPKELEIRLKSLIQLRQKLQSRYASLTTLLTSNDPAFQKQDAFMDRFRTTIESHMEDETFGILQIARKMKVSRTQLHNKLKALTGKSTSQVIRSIRLQKARTLLLTSEMNVSEVAYAVGFKNTTYFSSSFSEEFGLPPSELKNQDKLI